MTYKALKERQSSVRLEPLHINESQALVEAQRCLYCFDAPCTRACPVAIDVPGFIKRLAELNWEGSRQILYQANPLAAVCGLVCPTEVLCEGACVLSDLGQRPVRIGSLQYYVATRSAFRRVLPGNESDNRIAVIGAGPSGIGCAFTLRQLGCQVVIYERAESPGGLISQVIPGYRLPQEIIDRDLDCLADMGIEVRLGENISKPELQAILAECNAVFLGIGLHDSLSLEVPGSNLPGVVQAMDYLANARRAENDARDQPELGKRVVVVGGGNVALDAAVTAKLRGAEGVKVVYRRSFAEMPAWRSEFLEASLLGVEFVWMATIAKILGDQKVRSVIIEPMRFSAENRDGRRWIEKDPQSMPYEIPADLVLPALGQRLEHQIVEDLPHEVTGGSTQSGQVYLQLSDPKLFMAGDAAGAGSTVVQALAGGIEAGKAIHCWLLGGGVGR